MRRLGVNGPEIPPIVLGGNVYGWTLDEADAFRQFDRALDAGFNCIDTADIYTNWIPGHKGGESETVIGNWLAKTRRRGDVFIATKVGFSMGEGKSGLSARYIEQAVDASLHRLQTDYIDLYQTHIDDQETPIEETLDAFDRLVKGGKIRFCGASNYSASRLTEAMEIGRRNSVAGFISLQPKYNLLERQTFERELLPVVQTYGLGVISYYSLAAGFLTGKYRRGEAATQAARAGTVEKYRNDRGWAVTDVLAEVAAEYKTKPGIVALAWLLRQPGVTAAIASATSDEQFDDLLAVPRLDLSQESIQRLNDITSAVAFGWQETPLPAARK
jgi:aryl-alcohol dehydrogenase-like predicted oxidoreductase